MALWECEGLWLGRLIIRQTENFELREQLAAMQAVGAGYSSILSPRGEPWVQPTEPQAPEIASILRASQAVSVLEGVQRHRGDLLREATRAKSRFS